MFENGLRELRRMASELVHRVQAGEQFTITVAGRAAAVLVSANNTRAWRRWEELEDVFARPIDPDWGHDLELLDGSVVDP